MFDFGDAWANGSHCSSDVAWRRVMPVCTAYWPSSRFRRHNSSEWPSQVVVFASRWFVNSESALAWTPKPTQHLTYRRSNSTVFQIMIMMSTWICSIPACGKCTSAMFLVFTIARYRAVFFSLLILHEIWEMVWTCSPTSAPRHADISTVGLLILAKRISLYHDGRSKYPLILTRFISQRVDFGYAISMI